MVIKSIVVPSTTYRLAGGLEKRDRRIPDELGITVNPEFLLEG